VNSELEFNQGCRFPAIVLYEDGDLAVYEAQEGLTICSRTDLKAGQRGRFARATIVDSDGTAWEMDGATKLHSVGPFWGFNIFLNQSIRVLPTISAKPKPTDLDVLKSEIVKRVRNRGCVTLKLKCFCTIIEPDEARRTATAIQTACSIPEIIGKLLAMDFPEKKRLQSISA
jgi:hypothetical protein